MCYGTSTLSYGSEAVVSFTNLIEAIKRRQLLRPRSKLALKVGGGPVPVNLLPNGYIELDGKVPSIALEKYLDWEMQEHGATLEYVRVS
jgi:hypothetical protein